MDELRVTKGAVAVIAPMSGITGKELADLEEKMEAFASKGYRIIAVAVSHQGSKNATCRFSCLT